MCLVVGCVETPGSVLEVVDTVHVVASQEGLGILNSLLIFQDNRDVRRVLEKESRTAIFENRQKQSHRRELFVSFSRRLVMTAQHSFMLRSGGERHAVRVSFGKIRARHDYSLACELRVHPQLMITGQCAWLNTFWLIFSQLFFAIHTESSSRGFFLRVRSAWSRFPSVCSFRRDGLDAPLDN